MNKYIEYTYLKYLTSKEIKKFVKTANKNNYYGVCMPQGNSYLVKQYLSKDQKSITIAGFPHYTWWERIQKETKLQVALGMYHKQAQEKLKDIINNPSIDELDIIFPIEWYTQNKLLRITKFLSGVKKRFNQPVKVIIELGTIFTEEKHLFTICKVLKDSGIDFIKTNSGILKQDFFNLYKSIQKLKDYTLLPIKASGGIKTKEQINQLVNLGVKRIGTSAEIDYTEEEGNEKN